MDRSEYEPTASRHGRWQRAIASIVLLSFFALNTAPAVAQMRDAGQQPAATSPPTQSPRRNETEGPLAQLQAELASLQKQLKPRRDLVIKRSRKDVKTGKQITDITIIGTPEAPAVDKLRQRIAQLAVSLQVQDDEALRQFQADKDRLLARKASPAILQRHAEAVELVKSRSREMQDRLGKLGQAGTVLALHDASQALIQQLKVWNPSKHQPLDPKNLPFRSANPKVREPKTSPAELEKLLAGQLPRQPVLDVAERREETDAIPLDAISRAAHDGDSYAIATEHMQVASAGSLAALAASIPVPGPEFLSPTVDVQITPAIQAKAQELHNHPVEIYNWVRNNVDFSPTYGSIQGSDLTLQTLRGNAFDTASLLIALLRAAGTPARYVYGTVEVPMDRTMNWLGGMTAPETALNLLGLGGIPNLGLAQGGVVKAVRLEHVWVEAFVDFYPSRGAKNITPDAWVPMDASFKQYDSVAPKPLPPGVDIDTSELSTALGNVLEANLQTAAITSLHPYAIAYHFRQHAVAIEQALATQTPAPEASDILGARSIHQQSPETLAASVPWRMVARSQSYAALPAALRHSIKLEMFADRNAVALESPELTYSLSLPALAGRRVGLSYIPASDDDAQALEAHRGDAGLPLYAIRVVPQLSVDGIAVATGSPMQMGANHYWGLIVADPQGQNTRQDIYDITAGDEGVFGFDPAGLVQESIVARKLRVAPDSSVAENLHQAALHYWVQYDFYDAMYAKIIGVHHVRLPSAGLFSAPITVSYRYGIPYFGYYNSHGMDVKRAVFGVVGGNENQRLKFAQFSGFHGSLLEGAVFEQLFNRFPGTADSTTQALVDAAALDIPIYRVDSGNLNAVLPLLQVNDDVKQDITNGVNAGKVVIVPERPAYKTIGYLIQDPIVGDGAYRINDGANGGKIEQCKREALPIPQKIKEVLKTQAALYALALEAAAFGDDVISVAASVGTVPLPVPGTPSSASRNLAALLIALGVTALTQLVRTGNENCSCLLNPKAPAGGEPLHDRCARYIVPPDGNEFDNDDAVFCEEKEPTYDAVTGGLSKLWEVKTDNLENQKEFFVRVMRGPEIIEQAIRQSIRARKCGMQFNFLFGDANYPEALKRIDPLFKEGGYFDQLHIYPQCKQP